MRRAIGVPGPAAHNGVPMIRAQDYSQGWVDLEVLYRVSHTIDNAYKRSKVITGDVLLTIVGSVGNLAKVPRSFDGSNITQQTARLSFDPKVADADYYINVLQSGVGKKVVSNYTKSGVQPSLNLSDVAKFLLPRPPLPEQRAIAEALSDVDGLLGGLDRLIAKMRDLKQAAMQQLLTGHQRLPGFAPANPRFQQTDAGVIPDDWCIAKCFEITALIGKGASPKWQGFNYSDGGMLFVTSENVRDGFLDISEPKYLPLEFHEKLNRTKLQVGDILINLVGASIGRSCRITHDLGAANVNQAVAVFRLNEPDSCDYVAYYFQATATVERIMNMQVDVARPNISLTNLREFLISLPPTLAEQTAIAEVLSDMDAELAALEQKRDKTQHRSALGLLAV